MKRLAVCLIACVAGIAAGVAYMLTVNLILMP